MDAMTDKRIPLRRAKGFTLLEMLVVMFIIAMVMGISIPYFQSVFQTNLKQAMLRFTGMVKFCFHEAIIKQTMLRLNINPMTGEYWPSVLMTSGNVGEFMDLTGNDVIKKRAQLPQGIRFVDVMTPHNALKVDREEAFVSFLPTGYVERSVIHITDEAGNFYTMITQPLTGDVEVLDGYIDLVDVQQQKGPFSEEDSGF